jgi:hypothetical protein
VVDCNTDSNTGAMINTINDPNIVLDFPPLALVLTDNNIDNSSKHDTKTIDKTTATNNSNVIDTKTTAANNNNVIDTKTTAANNNNVIDTKTTTAANNNNVMDTKTTIAANNNNDTNGIIRGEIWGLTTMKGIFLISLK